MKVSNRHIFQSSGARTLGIWIVLGFCIFVSVTITQVLAAEETGETGISFSPIGRYQLAMISLLLTVGPIIFGLFCFMVFVHRKGSKSFEPFFGQGQIAQLVVIVLIAGNVCSLAILGILQKSEISALYGGIVGYVLGRRVSKSDQPENGNGDDADQDNRERKNAKKNDDKSNETDKPAVA